MNTRNEQTEPEQQPLTVDRSPFAQFESGSLQTELHFAWQIHNAPPRGISKTSLETAAIPVVPAVVQGIDEDGAVTVRIDIGGKRWHIEIPKVEGAVEFLTAETARSLSADLASTSVPEALDDLIGVLPSEVPVGSTISLVAHEYRGLESIEGVEPTEFERVKLLSRHNDQRSGNRLWTVEDQGQQKVLYVPELERTHSDDIARHVRIHQADPGFIPVHLPDVPQIKRELIYRFEPGWTVNVSGYQEDSATLDESERTRVTRVGKFVGYVDDIQVGDEPGLRLSLLVDGQLVHLDRTEYMDRSLETDGKFGVEIPVGYVPMSSQEVLDRYAKPVRAVRKNETSALQSKRSMPANQIPAGAIIVSKTGTRAEVRSVRQVAKAILLMDLVDADQPSRSQSLKVPAWKKFSVESASVEIDTAGTGSGATPITDTGSQEMSDAALPSEASNTASM